VGSRIHEKKKLNPLFCKVKYYLLMAIITISRMIIKSLVLVSIGPDKLDCEIEEKFCEKIWFEDEEEEHNLHNVMIQTYNVLL
jgi:hypothetical protein